MMIASAVRALRRDEIVRAARGWIGTPYHAQASVRGVGADCLGLVRGVWREVIGAEPETMPAYSADWTVGTRGETLLGAARRHFIARPAGEAWSLGDVLVFRCREARAAHHCGIATGPDQFVHAMERVPVSEVALGLWWRRRVAGVFVFPGVID